jgi:cytochrome d ubiquinol oxidase subunit I
MTDLFAARMQMAVSLGFHIVFAVVGMAMPLLMVIAQIAHRRTGDPTYRDLAHRWAKGTAILFAVGAVSGTVLSFELGLLWPRFMEFAGPLIGLPFGLEGFAFFLEAIALGIYLYGWDRVHPWIHIASGAVIALSGVLSGVFVTSVNGFMNTPAGFTLDAQGKLATIDPWGAFFNPAFPSEAFHMAVAAYQSVAFGVLGVHAWRLLADPTSAFHRKALHIAFAVAALSAPLQLVAGDVAASHVAEVQPLKLASAEGHFETKRGAPITVIGWPNVAERRLDHAIQIPKGLSLLAFRDPDAEVKGLEEFPEDEWPPIVPVFVAFHVMVGCGVVMLALALWGALLWWRKGALDRSRTFLRAAVLVAPLGIVAVEAGWTVTEVGRQPWIVRGVMRTADALTPFPDLWLPFVLTCLLYLFLGFVVVVLLRRHVFSVPRDGEEPAEAQP